MPLGLQYHDDRLRLPSQYGAGIYSGNVLGISGAVTILDGVFLSSEDNLIQAEGSLASAFVRLEQSPYLSPDPAKAPIDIASATIYYPALTAEDCAALVKPSSGFDDWYVRLSDDNGRMQLDFSRKYAVTYENLMGAHNPNPSVYDALTLPVALLPLDSSPCYCFTGWFNADGNHVTEIPVGTEGDLTLRARWERIPVPPMPCCCCRCSCGWCSE